MFLNPAKLLRKRQERKESEELASLREEEQYRRRECLNMAIHTASADGEQWEATVYLAERFYVWIYQEGKYTV